MRQIEREWLFISKKNKKELPYFVRDEEGIGVDEMLFAEGIGWEERTNDNRLFLSLVAQLGGTISKNVLNFFNSGYNVISGLNTQGYEGLTERQFLNKEAESVDALQFFKDLQLGFIDIETDEHEIEKGRKAIDVFTVHNIYNKDGEITGKQLFRFDYCESQGTQKLFELAGPLFEALRHGRLLVMDELDAKMHPLISQHIIKLLWFTEKDKAESTDLYSLMHIVLPDGTKPRGDGNLERNYIKGRYGAVPYLSTIE